MNNNISRSTLSGLAHHILSLPPHFIRCYCCLIPSGFYIGKSTNNLQFQEIWENKIPDIYKALNSWIGFGTEDTKWRKDLPHWFSFEKTKKHIFASIEPSGLQFSGLMEDEEWEDWKRQIKRIATKKLGFKVGEIELGEVG